MCLHIIHNAHSCTSASTMAWSTAVSNTYFLTETTVLFYSSAASTGKISHNLQCGVMYKAKTVVATAWSSL